MLLQPSPDGGGKLEFEAHGCFGGIDHSNALFMITLGMSWNFLVGAESHGQKEVFLDNGCEVEKVQRTKPKSLED